ncbi:HAMP domain-containing histidine kinase [Aliiroseovarius sp. S1339]|uniref:sensor histidine kinase n=1 Tax=Aliiroseovarius sp. S1339 TaxID=2936990 RepID=UPI0020C046E8|nr:HAMP domain-containing sensor histidine kinase [Aliiroseovarius sp. S1339]MCK8462411.1 HAMP domain-containing histidine kinase [Aliiroseovarius sp. S1339]
MTSANSNNIWRYLWLWAFAVLLALCGLAAIERQSLVRELTTKSATLHRLASQRADQHDAHLTSLSAIFVAGGVARQDLFLDVAATIMRFYPRITSVNVIPFDLSDPVIQTEPRVLDEDAALVVQMARSSTGALQVQQMPNTPDHYMVVKRTPNTDAARHGLALTIDARALVATDDAFWQKPSVSLRLLAPDGQTELTSQFSADEAGFSKALGSGSQPLIFETALAIRLADLLPIGKVLSAVALVTALFLLTVLGLRQRARTREAEGLAKLSAQETRLAHASRVNAMGEMASGMAHELAQPLTAILSQAQAGRRLARRGDVDRLGTVLDDTVTQAQRAADILDRLRRWSKPNRARMEPSALHEAIQSVQRLLASEAKSRAATITLSLHEVPLMIEADPVELEQVVFNLVRNALDASDGAQVTIRTDVDGEAAVLDVIDDGPGVPEDIKSRVFEPFVTSKPDGTGLGLALCQRLVEEMGGEIVLLSDAAETTFRLALPLSTKAVTP